MRSWTLALLAGAFCTACTGEVGGLDEGTDDGGSGDTGSDASAEASPTDAGVDSTLTDTPTTDTGVAPDTSAPPVDTGPADAGSLDTGPPTGTDAVCARWKGDRASLAEGAWSGSLASCAAGDVGAPGRANTLKLVNLYRWLSGLPAVVDDPARNDTAQSCALMMHANGTLSHSPPTSWKCYSAAGAGSAGKSNISPTPAVASIDLYMVDPGNATTIGHRRWILSNSLGPIGIGGTSGYSCLQVIGGGGSAGKEFTAWPPAGIVPLEAFAPPSAFSSVDATGWTVQSDSISFSGSTTATIAEDGVDKPVDVATLANGYGSTNALKITPKGWTTKAGKSYAVSVKGASKPIDYVVQVVACP